MSATIPKTKDVSEQLRSFQEVDTQRQKLAELLHQRTVELDASLKTAKSDLEDQTSIRRQWKQRAEIAEASLSRNQFVLVLIDGDRYTFTDTYLKNIEAGGAEAGRDLKLQIKSYLDERKIQNGPSELPIMIYMFANKLALAGALVDSGAISHAAQFDNFVAQVVQSQLFFYFVDCGSVAGTVDSKIQESYEFHFDNDHCKHLLLALRHDSGYVTELDTYRDDPSTLTRTSLIRSSHAVSGPLASTFPVADTPALRTIALISLEHVDGITVEKRVERNLARMNARPGAHHELRGLFETVDAATTDLESDKSSKESSRSPGAVNVDSSTTSSSTGARSVKNDAVLPPDDPEPVLSPQLPPITIPDVEKLETRGEPTAPPMSSQHIVPFSGSGHSLMQDWENAPAENAYTPAPDLSPWGSEEGPVWQASTGTNDIPYVKHKVARDWPSKPSRTPSYPTDNGYSGMSDNANRPIRSHRRTLRAIGSNETVRDSVPSGDQNASAEHVESCTDLMKSTCSPSPNETPAKSQVQVSVVAVNRGGQRIDLLLPRPSPKDQASFNKRITKKKLCNAHLLRNDCQNSVCTLDHEPINQSERLALVIIARRLPCAMGSDCRRRDCFYGHMCPWQRKGERCQNKKCAFEAKGLHNVEDMAVDQRL